MPADKTVGEEEQTGRRRRSLLGRNRPEADEPEPDEIGDDESDERGITAGKGRATPSNRRQSEEEESGNVATRTLGSLREYIDGVRSELGKVVWPTREEAQRLTIIVLVTLVVSALVLGAISLLFTELFRIGLGSPIILLVVMLVGIIGGFYFFRVINRRPSY